MTKIWITNECSIKNMSSKKLKKNFTHQKEVWEKKKFYVKINVQIKVTIVKKLSFNYYHTHNLFMGMIILWAPPNASASMVKRTPTLFTKPALKAWTVAQTRALAVRPLAMRSDPSSTLSNKSIS